MRTWDLAIEVPDARTSDDPVYRRIAAVIAADIERGRLRPGERLSSTRILADQLGVNRNTVVAAFEVLRVGGWIEGGSTRGTFVTRLLPRRAPSPASPATAPAGSAVDSAGFDVGPDVPDLRPIRAPGLHLLLGGVPDLRLVPHRELARAYRHALAGARGRRSIDYADPQGNERLRLALGDLLARTRGIHAPPPSICVVRGSQHGLYLIARTLIRPGDVVAIEATGFPPGWRVMEEAGAELAPIAVDRDGLDVDALARLAATRRVRAVVVTPHHQYPTTVTLSAERRRRLLALAAAHRMIVVEDDYDFEFHYDGPPVLPLAASDPDRVVVYVATMSKSLAPGLRVGYVVAPPEVVRRIAHYRWFVDQQGDHVVEHAVASLLEDGVVQRHTRRARRAYRSRRDALVEALRSRIPEIELEVPAGGMAVWARVPGLDATGWRTRAMAAGVSIQAGRGLSVDGSAWEHVRLGFAACTEAELVAAVEILAGCR
ncbi:MAG: PLP-dependent aminotransferase family protein [Myxococcota bacterium]